MYPLVFFVTCFNLLYVLLLNTFLKCLILHRNAPHWRVCTNLKWEQIKVIFKNVNTRIIHVSIRFAQVIQSLFLFEDYFIILLMVYSLCKDLFGSSDKSCTAACVHRCYSFAQSIVFVVIVQWPIEFLFTVFEVTGLRVYEGWLVPWWQTAAVKMSVLWCDGHCF